jgi:hypothetical protein
MTIWRRALCGLLLLTVLTWLPVPVWGQAKKWTDAQCRARMEQLFKYASDPSVDISEVTDNLGPRAGTEFAMYCRIKEANSIQMLERGMEQLVAEREQTAESDWRVDRAGKHLENMKRQSSPYDPGGTPGGPGPATY